MFGASFNIIEPAGPGLRPLVVSDFLMIADVMPMLSRWFCRRDSWNASTYSNSTPNVTSISSLIIPVVIYGFGVQDHSDRVAVEHKISKKDCVTMRIGFLK